MPLAPFGRAAPFRGANANANANANALQRISANVITFCNGDLNPNTKQTTCRGWGFESLGV